MPFLLKLFRILIWYQRVTRTIGPSCRDSLSAMRSWKLRLTAIVQSLIGDVVGKSESDSQQSYHTEANAST